MERYIILQKLGWGHFSTVWLAKDLQYGCFVAIKIQKSAQQYLEAAFDEVEILEQVSTKWKTDEWKKSYAKYEKTQEINSDSCYCIQLLNSFIHSGSNGKHFAMVFEIMGVTLLEIIKRYNYRGIPLPLVRIIAKQVLIGLDYLHRICHIIHTDLKPENVLVCLTKDETKEIISQGQFGKPKSTYKYGSTPLIDDSDDINKEELKEISKSYNGIKEVKEKRVEKNQIVNEEKDEKQMLKESIMAKNPSELTEEEKKELKRIKKREKKKRLKKKKQEAKAAVVKENSETIENDEEEEEDKKENKEDSAKLNSNDQPKLTEQPQVKGKSGVDFNKKRTSDPTIASSLATTKGTWNDEEEFGKLGSGLTPDKKNIMDDTNGKPLKDR